MVRQSTTRKLRIRTAAVQSLRRFKASAHPLDTERIRSLELRRKRGVREALPCDCAAEAVDCHGSDRSAAAIGGRWERPAVNHAGADFHAGGETVENEATGALLQSRDKARVFCEFLVTGLKGGGELAFEAGDGGFDFRKAAADDQCTGTEEFALEGFIADEVRDYLF